MQANKIMFCNLGFKFCHLRMKIDFSVLILFLRTFQSIRVIFQSIKVNFQSTSLIFLSINMISQSINLIFASLNFSEPIGWSKYFRLSLFAWPNPVNVEILRFQSIYNSQTLVFNLLKCFYVWYRHYKCVLT